MASRKMRTPRHTYSPAALFGAGFALVVGRAYYRVCDNFHAMRGREKYVAYDDASIKAKPAIRVTT